MIKAAILTSVCLLAATLPSYSQNDTDLATREGIRRQYNKMVLRDTLTKADDALSRNDLQIAAKLYDDSWSLITSIGTGVDQEIAHTKQGIAAARMPLAIDAQKRDDLREADRQASDVLRIDPSNQTAITFKTGNDQLLAAWCPHRPNPEVETK